MLINKYCTLTPLNALADGAISLLLDAGCLDLGDILGGLDLQKVQESRGTGPRHFHIHTHAMRLAGGSQREGSHCDPSICCDQRDE